MEVSIDVKFDSTRSIFTCRLQVYCRTVQNTECRHEHIEHCYIIISSLGL